MVSKYNRHCTKTLRDRLDLSQEKLARLIDVSLYSVQRWEKGTTSPRANHSGRLYEVAAQNKIENLPLWVIDDTVIAIPIERHYEGPYTIRE